MIQLFKSMLKKIFENANEILLKLKIFFLLVGQTQIFIN